MVEWTTTRLTVLILYVQKEVNPKVENRKAAKLRADMVKLESILAIPGNIKVKAKVAVQTKLITRKMSMAESRHRWIIPARFGINIIPIAWDGALKRMK